MDYQEYKPRPELAAVIKCHWTLEVPAEAAREKQRVIPDGYIELFFLLGDDVRRYTSEDTYIIQPRAFVLGQITKPLFIEPTGYVNSFAVRFYPYGFASFISEPLKNLADKDTPLAALFGPEMAGQLTQDIISAAGTKARIQIIEDFLLKRFKNEQSINDLVVTTIDTILSTKGNTSIKAALKNDKAKRRQLERKFLDQVGMSPKQLSKVVRLQTALKMMLDSQPDNLSKVAYNSDYYDQAHFIKDFKEFTGITPKEFFEAEEMKLSSLFYKP